MRVWEREPDRYPHGTRSRYVGGRCRCDACRAANAAYYHERQAKGREAAAAIAPSDAPVARTFIGPDGRTHHRSFRRSCPGANGAPCPIGAYLRKDSKGGVCNVCRRALVFNGLVDARPVARHVRKLSRLGVGLRAVADAASASHTSLRLVLQGRRTRIRADLARRILEIDAGAIADGAMVDAAPTWRAVREMLRHGLTKGEIAERMGATQRALQLSRRQVRAATELRVQRLLREVRAEVERDETMPDICSGCAMSHRPADRQELLARMFRRLPEATFVDAAEAWPCLYPSTDAGQRSYHRDRSAVLAAAARAAA